MSHTEGATKEPLQRLSAALSNRYRIERELGAGGMATVYLAEDIKHDRKVAIKVLKPELAAVLGAERFIVEIKTTAALQHPHILPLFDSGEADGFLYYVMPYIQGETIREKLNRETQCGVDEAVRITREVADALDYAHRNGVIHRDIKPENILLHDGRAMVMDFGIALAVSAAAGGRMTETGLSLGTPHYMSPEQATAEKEISGRSDVYSLATVLYEMLTGNPPYTGASAQQIIMKIITEPAEQVTKYRKSVPANVAAALAHALEKLPADRFETARDFSAAIANQSFMTANAAGVQLATGGARWKQRAAVPLVALSVVFFAAALWGWLRPQPVEPVRRFDIAPVAAVDLNSDMAISPDGSMLSYTGAAGADGSAIYVRQLGAGADFHKLAGTEGTSGTPTFSPDSRSIAVRRNSDGALLRVDIASGAVTVLVRLGQALGSYLHWGTEDMIVYSGGPRGLFRIASKGGVPEHLNKTAGAMRYSFLLPDGSGLLFYTNAGVMVLDFKRDSATLLIAGGSHPVYVQSGHLLYVSDAGGLYAVPFDLRRHVVTGSATQLIDQVAASVARRGFSVSRSGALVYHEGASSLPRSAVTNRLAILDTHGSVEPLKLPTGTYSWPRFSPDGHSIVYVATTAANRDLHTRNLSTAVDTRITFEGNNQYPIWSADGKQVVFTGKPASATDTLSDLFSKVADNSAKEQPLLAMRGNQVAGAWLKDGTVVFASQNDGGSDLYTYLAGGSAAPKPYLDTPSLLRETAVSPDEKLAAYTSVDSGNPGVWISDFPVAKSKWQVSPGLGQSARWSRDGSFVYYWKSMAFTGDSLFRARVERTPSVVVHEPEFVLSVLLDGGTFNWDLHPDGKRLVVTLPFDTTASTATTNGARDSRYVIALNWFGELRAKTRVDR